MEQEVKISTTRKITGWVLLVFGILLLLYTCDKANAADRPPVVIQIEQPGQWYVGAGLALNERYVTNVSWLHNRIDPSLRLTYDAQIVPKVQAAYRSSEGIMFTFGVGYVKANGPAHEWLSYIPRYVPTAFDADRSAYWTADVGVLIPVGK